VSLGILTFSEKPKGFEKYTATTVALFFDISTFLIQKKLKNTGSETKETGYNMNRQKRLIHIIR
jgi:hypothetical protein